MAVQTIEHLEKLNPYMIGGLGEVAAEQTFDLFPDTFDHWRGSPSDPDSAFMLPIAWQTHMQGYLNADLAKPKATETGYLHPSIDKSRHLTNGIRYYLAINRDDPSEVSTGRAIDAVTIEDLPTYGLVGDNLFLSARREIERALSKGALLKEFGALANARKGRTAGASEILRGIITESLSPEEGPETLLFASMVVEAHAGLTPLLSPRNVEPIGKPTVLPENEYRKETVLVPILVHPDRFVANILASKAAERRPGMRARLETNAVYFSALFPARHLNEEVLALRAAMQERARLRTVLTEQ